jgi:Flp pilus assembly protein TadD
LTSKTRLYILRRQNGKRSSSEHPLQPSAGYLHFARRPIVRVSFKEENALAHGCLGAAWIQQQNPEQAEKHLRRALEINLDYPEALNDLGMILINKGLYPEAVTCLSNALVLIPKYAEAHNNLALTFMHMSRFPETIEHYKAAISINPTIPKAHNNLGSALARIGRLEEAKPYFLQALKIQPSDDEVYNNLGLLYFHQQDYVNAKVSFESGLRYNSNNPKAFFFFRIDRRGTGQRRGSGRLLLARLTARPGFSGS